LPGCLEYYRAIGRKYQGIVEDLWIGMGKVKYFIIDKQTLS